MRFLLIILIGSHWASRNYLRNIFTFLVMVKNWKLSNQNWISEKKYRKERNKISSHAQHEKCFGHTIDPLTVLALISITRIVSIWWFSSESEKVRAIIDESAALRVRNGSGGLSSSGDTEIKLISWGGKNWLQYRRFYSQQFNCHFYLHWYPFDYQTCIFDIKIPLNFKHPSKQCF